MILNRNYIAFFLLGVVLISCGSASDRKTSASDSAPPPAVSSDCQYGIQTFNKMASKAIMNEIKDIKASKGHIPQDLIVLYPKAKEAWNRALGANVYSSQYSCTTLSPLPKISDINPAALEEYQQFFFHLAEYKYGPYPTQSRDQFTKLAWIEKADCKKRMESTVRAALISNCHGDFEDLNKLVKPVLLPENIEDCLTAD